MLHLNSNTVVLNKNNFEEKLFELLGCLDADLTGENGPDYVYVDGYDSNLEYYIEKASKQHSNLKDIVNDVLNSSSNYWCNFYSDTNIKIIEHGDELIVSVSVANS